MGQHFVEKPAINWSTRIEAMRHVGQVAQESLDRGMRLMVGFDFPYSYPVGMTTAGAAIFGPGPQWRSVWEAFASRITDDPKNKNNRFQIADYINRLCNTRFFWVVPEGLPTTRFSIYPRPISFPMGSSPIPAPVGD